jgi:CubicO group peptidase (beta-lactamase class C family)
LLRDESCHIVTGANNGIGLAITQSLHAMCKILNLVLAIVMLLGLSVWTIPVEADTVSASEIDRDALDAYITAQMYKHGIRGISLAVTFKAEIVYLKGYGTAGKGRPMTPQTPMYIGSQSKSFTGLAIAQLIEQGKIRPNDPVQKYISWFKVADEEASKNITVYHLLHHTSGLSESGFTGMLPDDASNEDAVRSLASAELTEPVGAKHQYFNVGYDVLALIVQYVSGMTYEDYIQKNIFDPLDMTRTYTDPVLARENGLSQGYSRFFGFTVPVASRMVCSKSVQDISSPRRRIWRISPSPWPTADVTKIARSYHLQAWICSSHRCRDMAWAGSWSRDISSTVGQTKPSKPMWIFTHYAI